MRILVDGRYVADRFPGIGRYVFNLMWALGKQSAEDPPAAGGPDEILVLTNPQLSRQRFDPGALARDAACQLIACDIKRRLPDELLRLPPLVRRLAPSVLLSPFFLRPYLVACPVVVCLFDAIPLECPDGFSAFERAVFRVGARLACRRSAAVVTCSHASAEIIGRRFPATAGKLHVVPGACDPRLRHPPGGTVSARLGELGVGGRFALHVGGDLPHKNLATLIRAWAALRDQGRLGVPEAQLVLVGTADSAGRHGRSAPALAAELGLQSVRFLRGVSDEALAALYTRARVFVFPSLAEGFGLPVVEAMACGAPVVCARIPAFAEVAGDTACLVDPRNPAALAGAIATLLNDDAARAELVNRGTRQAASFSWSDSARRLRAILAEVAAEA